MHAINYSSLMRFRLELSSSSLSAPRTKSYLYYFFFAFLLFYLYREISRTDLSIMHIRYDNKNGRIAHYRTRDGSNVV